MDITQSAENEKSLANLLINENFLPMQLVAVKLWTFPDVQKKKDVALLELCSLGSDMVTNLDGSSGMFTPLDFVRSSESHHTVVDDPVHHGGVSTVSLAQESSRNSDGTAIREFYDQLILSTSQWPVKHVNERGLHSSSPQLPENTSEPLEHPQSCPAVSANQPVQISPSTWSKSLRLTVDDLLRSAAENNLQRLSQYISHGFDINSVDMFGWTAMMCAAQKGRFDAVCLLSQSGSDPYITNTKKQTAFDLAVLSKQRKIASYLRELQNYEAVPLSGVLNGSAGTDGPKATENTVFLCEVCEMTFQETTPEAHQTSILHQLHTGHKPARTVYGLPESNVGFRLLKRVGWNMEKGLGVNEHGRKFPVATVFKQDRRGFGQPTEQPKVTHYPHLLKQMQQRPVRVVMKKKDMQIQASRSRQQDIHLRRALNGI